MAKAPPSVSTAKWCPLIGRQCIEDACMFWLQIWGKNEKGEASLDADCAFNWQVQLQAETLTETARVTAGQDKGANEIATLNQFIALSAQARAQESALP